MKKRISNSTVWALGPLLAAFAGACASVPTPQELNDARSAYLRAQAPDGAAARFKPDQVHEAKVALDKAEASFRDDPKDQKTRDLAYIAQRKAELAEASGANEVARAQVEGREWTTMPS